MLSLEVYLFKNMPLLDILAPLATVRCSSWMFSAYQTLTVGRLEQPIVESDKIVCHFKYQQPCENGSCLPTCVPKLIQVTLESAVRIMNFLLESPLLHLYLLRWTLELFTWLPSDVKVHRRSC